MGGFNGLLLLLLVLLSACSDKPSEVKVKEPIKKVMYSQINPTGKFPAGSIWRVEYDDQVWSFPMDLVAQRGKDGFLDIYFTWPDMKNTKNRRWPLNPHGVRISFSMPNYSRNWVEKTLEKTIKGEMDRGAIYFVNKGDTYPGLEYYQNKNYSGRYFVGPNDKFLTPQGNPKIISCSGYKNKELESNSIKTGKKCQLVLDNGDGVSLDIQFGEDLLKNWKVFFNDVEELLESFKEIK